MKSSKTTAQSYAHQTLAPLNCLLFLAPLLLFFQIGTARFGTDLLTPHYMQKVLRYFGATAAFLPAMLIVVVLLVQHATSKRKWTIQPHVLAGMLGESIIWTAPLVALSLLTGWARSAQVSQGAEAGQFLQRALGAVGAGIYEEFVFRLVFISLAMLVFVDVLALRRDVVAIVAVVVGAVIFGLCHLPWSQIAGPEPFDRIKFAFLATAGVYWGGLYIFRGLAIAVGSHVLWDLYVIVGQG